MSTSHSPTTHLPTTAVTTAGRPPRSADAPGTKAALPYHRLARAHPSYRWWRPVLTLLVTAVTWSLLLIALVGTAMVASALDPTLGVRIDAAMDPSAPLDMHNPITALLALGLLALGLPAALLGVRVGGWRPAGSVSSVIGRLRWGLLIRCLGLAAALHLVVNLVLFATGTGTSPMAPHWGPHSGWALAVALLVVPFQAAAEEYVFRGVLMQTIGSWLRHPAWAILLPVPLFVLGHEYEWVGQLDIVVFAIAAAWLTWRTGGLEAAIGLHIIGNCLAFGFGAIGLTDLNATDIPPLSVAASIALTLSYTGLVTRAHTWSRTLPPTTATTGADY
ncbi:CPBP family intramembrane glutamic endopeptidase [Kocuria oceani]|uniref:CPBP family intramembrane glutamic endopeptidase n=1 Tax=Kocuria oceani TaxID=988827 RepID=A0ABV9TQI7_9MICC|nr:CPBP family intramembrane glutamic endopeptidase [Kocuria oceani]